MKIIHRRERIEHTNYMLIFDFINLPGEGFSFVCDKDGQLLSDATPEAKANFLLCVSGQMEPAVKRIGVKTTTCSWVSPTIGICCGEQIELDRFTNTCGNCGADYDSAGNRLAPRSQWGEETGESIAEIMEADTDPFGEQ